MKILILSRNPALYSTARQVEAAQQRGHEVEVIDYLRCHMRITTNTPQVVFLGRSLKEFDAVIPRIGATQTFYGPAVVRQFQEAGVYTLNTSAAISRSRDKLRSLQILAGAGIDMPATGFGHATRDIEGLLETVGGAPLVVKLLEGTQGKGVVLAETKKSAESVIGAFRQLDANFIVQKFISEANGSDIRAFVVGNRVVAAMMRTAPPGEFRSNVHQGGTVQNIKLTPKERGLAIRAAKAMGLNVAGVDLIRSDDGPLLLEINSSPGLQGIEAASGIDVAGEVIDFLTENATPGRPSDSD